MRLLLKVSILIHKPFLLSLFFLSDIIIGAVDAKYSCPVLEELKSLAEEINK